LRFIGAGVRIAGLLLSIVIVGLRRGRNSGRKCEGDRCEAEFYCGLPWEGWSLLISVSAPREGELLISRETYGSITHGLPGICEPGVGRDVINSGDMSLGPSSVVSLTNVSIANV
jgi:hypothetical protein